MRKFFIKFLLLTSLTAPFITDTYFEIDNIEERIVAYFFYMNAMQSTEKVIGDNLRNEVGYDANGDTTYYLVDINKDKMPDIILIYTEKNKKFGYKITN